MSVRVNVALSQFLLEYLLLTTAFGGLASGLVGASLFGTVPSCTLYSVCVSGPLSKRQSSAFAPCLLLVLRGVGGPASCTRGLFLRTSSPCAAAKAVARDIPRRLQSRSPSALPSCILMTPSRSAAPPPPGVDCNTVLSVPRRASQSTQEALPRAR